MSKISLGANCFGLTVSTSPYPNMFELPNLQGLICVKDGNERDADLAGDLTLKVYDQSTTASINQVALSMKHENAYTINFTDIKHCKKVDFLNYFDSDFWEKT